MWMEKTPWEKAVEFHGHVCPGLTIGFRAAEEALRRLGVSRAGDEELVAIVENEACGVDAVQVLTGCTFGKGNLLFRDWGKQVFTFVRRRDGRGIRVAVQLEAMRSSEEKRRRPEELARGTLGEEEAETYRVSFQNEVQRLRQMPAEELFTIREVQVELSGKAQLFQTVICSICGEGVMEPRARVKDGQIVCLQCAEEYEAPVTRLLKAGR